MPSDWSSLKDTHRAGKEHAARTGHKVKFSEFGAACGCGWYYVALQVSETIGEEQDFRVNRVRFGRKQP